MTVLHVVDGDTIRVRLPGGPTPVRLIGIDAPEEHESDRLDRAARRSHRSKASIQALGRLATDFTRQHLLGRSVSLELAGPRTRFLPFNQGKFGGAGNPPVSPTRAGYATAYTVAPNVKYATWFRALEREARAAGRGLWGRGLGSGSRRRARSYPPRAARISFASRAKTPGPSLPSAVSTWTAFAPFAIARRTS